MFKILLRTIRKSLGRYIAIVAIVALGVGFFCGLKSSVPAMHGTAADYLNKLNQYDFLLMSTIGITDDDISDLSDIQGISRSEGGYKVEALAFMDSDRDDRLPYVLLSIPEKISVPVLIQGDMPTKKNECLVDRNCFDSSDIGKKITVDSDDLKRKTFTITGLCQSPRFISEDRGNTSLGDGTLHGFIYLRPEVFSSEVFHEAFLTADIKDKFFSDAYASQIKDKKTAVEETLRKCSEKHYDDLKKQLEDELKKAKEQAAYGGYENSSAPNDNYQASIDAQANKPDQIEEIKIDKPQVYILDNSANTGYANFENDTNILTGVADAFPLFFALIAALVCITTMTRMAGEERTQIGTLKALGYSTFRISANYSMYACSASLLGCIIGFFAGVIGLPKLIWIVYGMNYDFASLKTYISPYMLIIAFGLCLVGAIIATAASCKKELHENAAELMRPKTPPGGKKIILERITPIWKRFSFLNKVMLRNAFRYKQRMIMMLIGISGCTALMVTGFGIKDSVANILNYQYDEIQLYDGYVLFDDGCEKISDILDLDKISHISGYQDKLDIYSDSSKKEANIIALSDEDRDKYISLHDNSGQIKYPKAGEVVLSLKLSEKLNVSKGDMVKIKIDNKNYDLKVTGCCDNYIEHYAYIDRETLTGVKDNAVYFMADKPLSDIPARLRAVDLVKYVGVTADAREAMDESMSSLNYVVLVLIVFAGALALVVLYDLTNINIMERMREVATVKVIGFFPKETHSYVLRENILLTAIGAFLGLFLGKLLHWYVMMQVNVDRMTFDIRIAAVSYAISYVITIIFAIIANFLMRVKVSKINMAESMKAVE